MQRRRLGRSGLSLSALTLGTDAAASLSGPALRDLFALAFDSGIDTVEMAATNLPVADALGAVVRSGRAPTDLHILCRIAPLVPLPLPAPHFLADQVYPGAHIRAQVDALLARLGTDRIALVHLPVWSPEWLGEGDWLDTLEQLRNGGKIADFGVATFDHDADAALSAVESGRIGSVQVMLNLFDPQPMQTLLPLCAKHDVAVIARAPLYHGGLVAGSAMMREGATWGDWRDAHFYPEHRAETAERARLIADDLAGEPVVDAAIRFCLTHDAVASVAVGMRTPAHVAANVAAARDGPRDPRDVAMLASRHRWLC